MGNDSVVRAKAERPKRRTDLRLMGKKGSRCTVHIEASGFLMGPFSAALAESN